MHHTDTIITTTIPSITTNTDESSFPVNSWGYSLSNASNATTFSSIPSSTASATIKTTSAPITEDQTDITFAAKIDTSIPAGTYQDTVVFTATTNYVPPPPFGGISNMQDMTAEICANATVGDTATLTDTRDNKTYTVAKLADNKCWMTQNLHLVGPLTLTPADSNVVADFALPASSTNFGATDNAAGIDIARVNDTGRADYGAYYNWYTATAGTGTYAMTSGDATASICPKGWRLPTGSSGGEILSLYNVYGNYNDFMTATSAILSGFWADSSPRIQGTGGYWWSSSVYSNSNGYYLALDSSAAYPLGNGEGKRFGFSVRCVAR